MLATYTLILRAVAGESGVAFISSSASEFIEMYMGLGAARVRDVFNTVGLHVCQQWRRSGRELETHPQLYTWLFLFASCAAGKQ